MPVVLPVLGPVRAKLPGLEEAWGSPSCLPCGLADMTRDPDLCQQGVVPPCDALAVGGVLGGDLALR